MKTSEGVSVIIRDFSLNPRCFHGPTILFSLKNGNKFFGCSAFRRNCFHMELEQFERNKEKIMRHTYEKKYQQNLEDQKTSINDKIQQPSLFLPQLDNDNLNAQYFFDNSTLQFITSIFTSSMITNVICIGTPRLHDHLRVNSISSILLDIDARFQPYYPNEFCHYNMFNHHFFQTDQEKLENFLKETEEDENSHHCIFVDPPFAARTELLTITLKTIANMYFKNCRKQLPIFWVFPYFNEIHVRREMPEMEMLDYQVTYTNHNAFNKDYKGRKEGSPVRIFTNIPQNVIKYPSELSHLYRYCKKCLRYVAINNRHCEVCKICPSKNGSEYKHCETCIKCVKPNYVHCEKCGRCVQKLNHDCKIYQSHQECWACLAKGHVENNCKKIKKFKIKKGKCRICGEKHNLKVCERKKEFL